MSDLDAHSAANFHRDGALLLKQQLSQEWLDLLASGLDQAVDQPDGMSGGVGQPLRIDQFPAERTPALKQFIETSPVAGIVQQVLGAPVRFYMDQMFYKPAGKVSASGWHQDTCYYNVAGSQLIRAWVSVDPVPREASIEVLRGSHLWNVTYRPPVGVDPAADAQATEQLEAAHARGERLIGREAHQQWTYFDSISDHSLPPLPDVEANRDSFDILNWDFEPGDILLFHGHVVHAARGGHTMSHSRRAHASLWAGPDVHYLHRRSQVIPDPIGLYNYDPEDGQLLSEFPDVFPLADAQA